MKQQDVCCQWHHRASGIESDAADEVIILSAADARAAKMFRTADQIARLPHNILAEMLAAQYNHRSDPHLCTSIDNCMSSHFPLPQWCTDVIITPDVPRFAAAL